MLVPLFILAIGAIGSGILFKELLIGYESSKEFWKSSIKFLQPLSTDHPPYWFVLTTPIIVTITIPISFYLFAKNKNFMKSVVESNKPFYNFLQKKWYFDELYAYIFVKPCKSVGYFFWKKIDESIIDKYGPDGISNLIKNFSFKAIRFQTGFIYQYAFVMLLGFTILLTLIIL